MNRRELILGILAAPFLAAAARLRPKTYKLNVGPPVLDEASDIVTDVPAYPMVGYLFISEIVHLEYVSEGWDGQNLKSLHPDTYTELPLIFAHLPKYCPHRRYADIYVGRSRSDVRYMKTIQAPSGDDRFIDDVLVGPGERVYMTYAMLLPSKNDKHGYEQGHDVGMSSDCRKCKAYYKRHPNACGAMWVDHLQMTPKKA
jgi:hypothetical protein